jgi:hypothetical protein
VPARPHASQTIASLAFAGNLRRERNVVCIRAELIRRDDAKIGIAIEPVPVTGLQASL